MHHLRERGTLDWDNLRIRSMLSDDGLASLRAGTTSADTLGRVLTVEMALAATGTEL